MCATCGRENPDGFRHCGFCGAALTAAPVERRKLATLVFCDLSGSTALGERTDPESVRALMRAYFDEMRAALERHGGTVEKFIGDAVVAAFGVPEAHEDDALRACRAALEMQARVERRFGGRIAIRIGVNTGEVVAGDTAMASTFVTGDAVNVAARLEQAAAPGEVLLGETTVRLLRDAIQVAPTQPLQAKGKSEPLAAYRLVAVSDVGPVPRRVGTPFAGREQQLRLLEDEFAEVAGSRQCRLVTLIGEAGVGKSRLASELARRVDARLVRGTCLSYGEGVTYWAIAQVVRELAGIRDEHSRDEALAHLEAHVARQANARDVATMIAQLLGLAEGAATPAETAWAIRSFLEAGAGERPLLVVVDDIHWADSALLDLVEALPAAIGAAPILLVCLARPELLERRSGWRADLRLEPLDGSDVAELIESLAGETPVHMREQLARISAGNPLFVEELVAMVLEEDGDVDTLDLPTSLHALLGARLDRLEPGARDSLERGAVEGEVFHRGAVVELSEPDARAQVPGQLAELARRDFVRIAEASFAGESAFRFKHVLVRDTAYRATSKSLRATLHEQFAVWLERAAGARTMEHEAILGHHLERSYRYRVELGVLDEDTRALGDRAALRFASAGHRAHASGEARAAATLFARAAELSSAPLDRAGYTLRQAGALREALAFTEAEDVLERVRAEAAAAGWDGVEAGAEVELAMLNMHTSAGETASLLRAAGSRALAVFEKLDDDHGVALALLLLARERWQALRLSEMEELLDRALRAAERAGDQRLVVEVLKGLAQAAVFGPRPAEEAVARGELLLARAREIGPMAAATIAMLLGVTEATLGNRDRARALGAESRAVMEEVAPGWMVAGAELYAGLASLTVGDPEHAEAQLRDAGELLAHHGERAVASTVAALRARALLELGRHDEAEREARLALAWADAGDVVSQAYARGALGRLLAARGALDEGAENARQAVQLSAASDFLNQRGDALFDLALVLEAAGEHAAARTAATDAMGFYREKGNVVQLTRLAASPIMTAHPVKGDTMSENEPDRPAPDDPATGQPGEADILFPETEDPADILHPEQDDSDSDD
jgi:class 3 adenylate cyclase/tetratricopeptide (TPR) repeat protein